jgi:hypothetical protein
MDQRARARRGVARTGLVAGRGTAAATLAGRKAGISVDAAANFEKLGAQLFLDPWAARNAYIQVILDEGRSREAFLKQHARQALSAAEEARALTLLEIQRNSMLMFTSCGWFFSDLAGIETIQVMRYAARVIDLQNQLGLQPPRKKFLQLMAAAQSNVLQKGTGAEIYLRSAESLAVTGEPTAAIQ